MCLQLPIHPPQERDDGKPTEPPQRPNKKTQTPVATAVFHHVLHPVHFLHVQHLRPLQKPFHIPGTQHARDLFPHSPFHPAQQSAHPPANVTYRPPEQVPLLLFGREQQSGDSQPREGEAQVQPKITRQILHGDGVGVRQEHQGLRLCLRVDPGFHLGPEGEGQVGEEPEGFQKKKVIDDK
ncbi:hypothetical protein NGA_0448800, partial [Nannochloropsis gaditana CCMP526]|uniref:uncharacterized protein n=1 Tax=Nannochloropsis gaditana (strain CCMP526) TaxID=1093141 RepID=UPI00029F7510